MKFFSKRESEPEVETRDASFSVGDPALAEYLGFARTAAGISVTEKSSLGSTAVFRAVNIIAGTIASLPMKSYRLLEDGSRERVSSILDDPGAPIGLRRHAWTELVVTHLLLHGNAYLLHIRTGAGALAGLQPIHPNSVSVTIEDGIKVFTIQLEGGQREFTQHDLTHIMGLSLDGITGVSPLSACRDAIGTGLAGDQAQGKLYSNGLMLGGLVSSSEHLTPEQAEQIRDGLKSRMSGTKHAGDVAVVNADLKFLPWTMSAEHGQFIESRSFQIEEISRVFGVPKVLLASDGASSWGTGIGELIRGMSRFTFKSWTSRIEDELSALLSAPRYVEFDFAGLLAPTPSEAIESMKIEIETGLLTVEEGRRILNRPSLTEVEA